MLDVLTATRYTKGPDRTNTHYVVNIEKNSMTVTRRQLLFQWVELMVLVYEKGSGQPSLPSRRWLCADTSAVFPHVSCENVTHMTLAN